jgi:hypothetical protein
MLVPVSMPPGWLDCDIAAVHRAATLLQRGRRVSEATASQRKPWATRRRQRPVGVYRTRVPAAVSQWSGLSDFGSGASFAPIVTPTGVPGGQIAT